MADPAGQKDLRSVFVKGVGFDTTSEEFEAAFSEIGPVRRAFLLQKKDAKRHSVSIPFSYMQELNVDNNLVHRP